MTCQIFIDTPSVMWIADDVDVNAVFQSNRRSLYNIAVKVSRIVATVFG